MASCSLHILTAALLVVHTLALGCHKTHDDLNVQFFMRCLDATYVMKFSLNGDRSVTRNCGFCANVNYDNCHEDFAECQSLCHGLHFEYKGRKSKNKAGLCGIAKYQELARSYWNGKYEPLATTTASSGRLY